MTTPHILSLVFGTLLVLLKSSIFKWLGYKIHCDTEVQLLIKTDESKFTELNAKVNELHPYNVVEVIALNIQQGDKHYLNWISNSLK